MSAVLELPRIDEKAIALSIEAKKHAVFFDVSWETYENLLAIFPERLNPKLFFDQGVLEIVPLSPEHENLRHILLLLVEEFADEMKIDVHSIGQSTLKNETIEQGFEPDCSFYFEDNAQIMRGKNRIVLGDDPSPDLVIEVDITHSPSDKLAVFAEAVVWEVWICENQNVKILLFESGSYKKMENSMFLPNVSSQILTELMLESFQMKRFEWREKVREWAKQNLQK